MQLLSLYINNYKNLKEFRWDISDEYASPALLILGKNASGKTNLLEAILLIFDFLYNSETKKIGFSFEIEYVIEAVKIKIIGEEFTFIDGVYIDDQFVPIGDIIRVNSTFKPRFKDYSLENILPENIVLYYSGFSQRFLPISNHIKSIYSRKFRKQKDISLPPILCLEPFHYKLILLSLFSFDNEATQIYNDFLKKYFNIESLHSFEIIIKKHTGWIEDKEYNNFFNIEGIGRNFLIQLEELQKKFNTEPLKTASNQNKKLINYVNYKFEGNDALIELKYKFGYENDIFKILNILYITNNLNNVILKFNKTGIDEPISFRDLSEGEQQFLAIQGMRFLLQGKDTLFLWDEPDTFLNPSWQWNLIPNLEDDYKTGDIQRDQFILTTHSPVLLGTVSKRAYYMENGDISNIDNTFGLSVDETLIKQNLSSRIPDFEEKLKEYYSLIESNEFNTEKALSIRKELEEKFGKDHEEMQRANVLISFYE